MKKVFLQYNPFLVETVITIDGKPIARGGELESKCHTRLQTWLYNLFPLLDKEIKCKDPRIAKRGFTNRQIRKP